MTRRDRPARFTPVADAERLLTMEPLVLSVETTLLAALRAAATQPATRVIAVVDSTGRLVGVLPVRRLSHIVVARVAPEALMASLEDIADIAAFGHAVEAQTVGEAMLEPTAVTLVATIDDAFRKMLARHQSGIYVVDDAGRPIGYLDLLELALVYADVLEGATERSDDTGAL